MILNRCNDNKKDGVDGSPEAFRVTGSFSDYLVEALQR